jgi:photosystem II stability/assembly factor-like uncharacterized protein
MKRFFRYALAILWLAILAPAPHFLHAQSVDENLLKGMSYRAIGPFRGGRVLAVTGVAGDPSTYYFGAVSGGVWKTADGGVTWRPVSDDKPFSSVGAIAVAPSDPNTIYVGTGESCWRGNITYGNGVWKSTDAGNTWSHMGLDDTRHISHVLVDPRNPNIVLVAAMGHAFGPNEDRGVFRSTDGGKTWQKVLYKDENTGAIELTFDPSNSNVVFAALYQARRYPWDFTSGGPGSGMYKSTDGGVTWTQLTGHGLPSGILGRVGIAVSGADSSRIYALIEAKEGGLYTSSDAGGTWTKVNDDHRFRQRAWYFTHIFTDPKNTSTLYILNTGLFRSTDGGQKFDLLHAPHGDHHGLWIDPTNPNRMINGNDGGATITVDGGKTWTTQDNQPTAQFYHVVADSQFLYHVYGAQQDNSTIGIASRTDRGYIGEKDWDEVGGGESGYIAVDPRDPNIIYAGDNGGTVTRRDMSTGQTRDISVWPDYYSGHGDGELTHRFQWTAPIVLSPNDPNTLYIGGEEIFMTTNGGASWSAISPDLTRNDKSKQVAAGGSISKDNTSVEYYDTVFTIAESPLSKGQIWAGSDDGLIHLTRDSGKNWQNVTPAEMPEWGTVSLIEASPSDAAVAYAAVDRHRMADQAPYILVTRDYGKSWTVLSSGIPDGSFVHAVREDPARKDLLFAGTETGVYFSLDGGAHWQPLKLNLPQTPIHDLIVKNNDLVVATHGRSFWILDDISPLRQMASRIANDDVHLFEPAPAWRYRTGGSLPERYKLTLGENPPEGAVLYYFLKADAKDEVTIEILDSQSKVVRTFSSKHSAYASPEQSEWPDQQRPNDVIPAAAGLNRFAWDLRLEGPRMIPGSILDGGAELHGPFAVPGKYQARLTVAGKSYTAPIDLKFDPRLKASPEELRKQLELGNQIRASFTVLSDTMNQIRDTRAQLDALKKRIGSEPPSKPILDAAAELDKKTVPIEDALVNKNIHSTEDSLNYPVQLNDKLAFLAFVVESADTAPTEQSYAVFDVLSKQVNEQAAKWNQIKSTDLPALNDQMRKAGVQAIYPAAKTEGAGK